MTTQKAYDEPTNVQAVDGEVTLDGPDGVGVSMTVAAARETGRRLLEKADEAETQSPSSGDEGDAAD